MAKNYVGLGDLPKADSIYNSESNKYKEHRLSRAMFKKEILQALYPDSTFSTLPEIRKSRHEIAIEKNLQELELILIEN